MTCNNTQLLELAPTTSTSPYFRDSLQGIYVGILSQPGVNFGEFSERGLETNDEKLEFCLAALSMRFRQQRETLKAANGLAASQNDGQLDHRIGSRKAAEANSWHELIDFQALTIATGVAEFSEHSRRGSVKDLYLNVMAGGKRNQGIGIYSGMWGHLGEYAAESNETVGKPGQSYVPKLGTDLTAHLESLPPACKQSSGIQLARLGRTVIYGSLQGTPASPTNVILKLKQETGLPKR